MKTSFPLCLAALLPLATDASEPPGDLLAFQDTLVRSIDRAAPAVVKVRGANNYGSGVIVHPDGLIVTNHRLAAAGSLQVTLADGTLAAASVLASDAAHDISLLRIDRKDLPHLVLAGTDPLPGAWVAVIGKAYYRADGNQQEVTKLSLKNSNSVTFGAINARSVLRDPERRYAYRETAMFLDAQINPGSEGGAVIDAAGTLVGVVAQLQNDAGTWDEIDFAVPASAIRELARSASRDLPRAPPGAPAAWDALSEGFRSAVHRAAPGVVQVLAPRPERKVSLVPPKGGPGPFTGVLIDAQGHVLTSLANFPDADAFQAVEIVTADGRRFPAKPLGKDLRRDLLLLVADGEGPFTPPEFADPKDARPGQFAIAVSASFGFPEEPAFHAGIVSALERDHLSIQTDAMLLLANRGGPLIDRQGRVLGILTQFCRQQERDMEQKNGVAFAVPMSVISPTLDRLKRGETLDFPWMGVGFAGGMNEPGCMVTAVAKDGPAQKAGLKIADLVQEVDGHRVLNQHQFQKWIQLRLPGESAILKVERFVKRKPTVTEISVTLGERKKRN